MTTGIDVGLKSYLCMIDSEKLLAMRFPVTRFGTFSERVQNFWERFRNDLESVRAFLEHIGTYRSVSECFRTFRNVFEELFLNTRRNIIIVRHFP